MTPADQKERDRIHNDLTSTLVVEAAAGTGKTTVLVERILSLFRQGLCRPQGLAALTFTEKAAGEMKLRIRERLEQARAQHPELEEVLGRLEEAQIATFHSFCATCLQEYPVEAGVDIDFETLDQDESARLFNETFQLWLQQKLQDPPEGIRRFMRRRKGGYNVLEAGGRLESMAWALCGWREFRRPWEGAEVDRGFHTRGLVERLRELNAMRQSATDRYHNYVQDTWALDWFLTRLQQRESVGADPDLDGLEAALAWLANQKNFKKPKKGRGKAFGPNLTREDMLAEHELVLSEITDFINRCDAHLVALLQQELLEAVDAYQEAKRRRGALDFLDLLLATRRLMVESPRARAALQQRYTHIFVDEFQDTDPLQAEILFLLSSQDPDETNWKATEVTPGKLFVVGDPKQSIYRFRRADVGTYFKALERLGDPLQLTTSFRSVPSIQSFINRAFTQVMTGDTEALQAHYVPLTPFRPEAPSQPSVVALRVPVSKRTKENVESQTPVVIASFVEWMLEESGWTVDDQGRRPVEARDVCILFRNMQSWGNDLTRPYIDELQARGVESLVVGGRSYHSREEVSTLVTCLEAIEWPQDELALFATLRGPLFAVDEALLYLYRRQHGRLNMLKLPPEEDRYRDITEPLRFLADLHRRRNRRPVADTVAELLEYSRYYAALVLRPRGEQALANALNLAERARHYDARENLSFRGFVDTLVEEAKQDVRAEAPILEQTSDGVRMMTVHAAKGLEFPIVILAVPGSPLLHEKPGRHLDPERELCLLRFDQLVPSQLAEVEPQELAIERAEGERLCYVAATRARDILVFPGFDPTYADEEWVQKSWLSPLWSALEDYECEAPYDGPLPRVSDFTTLPFTWFASGQFTLQKHSASGVRQDEVLVDLITNKDVEPGVLEEGRLSFQEWEQEKSAAIQRAAVPSVVIRGPKEAGEGARDKVRVARVERQEGRPAGPRFGSLVHAVLERVALTAGADEVSDLVAQQGRVFGATDEECLACEVAVVRALEHPVMERARGAEICLRESPLSFCQDDGGLVSGVIDLAYKIDGVWTVVDFKTDEVLGEYLRQVGVYVLGVEGVTGCEGEGWVLLV